MGITLHCKYCGKKIEAPDNAGGKWGKCPSCHNKLYVPDLNSGEELKLVPIDETDQEKQKRLVNETLKLRQDILLEREGPEGPIESTQATYEISDRHLTENIIFYLRQMADNELDEATRTTDSIIPHGQQAVKILDRIAVSEIPEPELADIAPQVLSGLIRDMRSKINE